MMKKLTALMMTLALMATLAVPALAAEPLYTVDPDSPYNACKGNRSCPMWYFSDLAGDAWYHEGVHYCLDRMMITGRTGPEDSSFDPEGTVTREDLIRTLYRSAATFGADLSVGEDTNILGYRDALELSQDSRKAFQWACGIGLAGGEDKLLAPNTVLSRTDLIMTVYSFVQWLGLDVSLGEHTNILSYDDAFDIRDGAFEAFQWACGSGVIRGVSQTRLDPNSDTNRAQLATVLMRVDGLRRAAMEQDGQPFDPLGAHFAGQWVHENTGRCAAQITGNGVGPFKVTIHWSNSAFSYSQWEMTGVHQRTPMGGSRLVVQDCVRYDVTYVEENKAEYTAVEIGALELDYSNSFGRETIRWDYAPGLDDPCFLVRESYQVTNPIAPVPGLNG